MYDNGLAYTGTGLALGSVVIGAPWLVVIAIGLVGAGALLVRFGWRRGQGIDQA